MAKGKQARGGEEPLSKAQEAVQAEVQQAKKVVREKKTFDLPGQIRETPLEGDTLRKFYTSLTSQKPKCAMAKKWLVQHGCLERDEAEALLQDLVDGGHLKSPGPSKRKRSQDDTGSPAPRPRKKAAARPRAPSDTPQARSRPAARPKAAARPRSQAKPTPRKRPAAREESSAEESDSGSDADTPLAKRAQKQAAAKPSASKRATPAEYESESEDSAGDADSSDDDSQDDLPLAKRK